MTDYLFKQAKPHSKMIIMIDDYNNNKQSLSQFDEKKFNGQTH